MVKGKSVRKRLHCDCIVERDKLGTEFVRFCVQHTPRAWIEKEAEIRLPYITEMLLEVFK